MALQITTLDKKNSQVVQFNVFVQILKTNQHSHLFSILHCERVSKSPISVKTTQILLLMGTSEAKAGNISLCWCIENLCIVCGKTFVTPERLREHKANMHKIDQGTVTRCFKIRHFSKLTVASIIWSSLVLNVKRNLDQNLH